MSYPCAACGGTKNRKNAVDCSLPIPCVPDLELIRPTITMERIQEYANRLDQIFRQRHTDADVKWELCSLLRETGVTVEGK